MIICFHRERIYDYMFSPSINKMLNKKIKTSKTERWT